MLDDPQLLRRYVAERSQDAFAEIVRRRVDLVYSVALRQVAGDAHLAKDVTQKVFADLARKASTLLERPALSGWLYRSTHYAASDMVRSERRRRVREQETYAMQDQITSAETQPDWDRLRPMLDNALGELDDADRDAVALRFFEGRAFAEIGRALQLTEEAARKRVERALDKLAGVLSRYGVTSTAAAIGLALTGQASVAAPAGLAISVTGAAVSAAGVGVAGSALWSWFGSNLTTVGIGTAAVLAGGAAIYQTGTARQRQAELDTLATEHARRREQVTALEQRLQTTTQRLQATEARAAEAEKDAAMLLAAIQGQSTTRGVAGAVPSTAAAAPEPLTHDMVQARYRRAQQLARTGDPQEALSELLWCFDIGMPPIAGFGGVRKSFLLSDLARLGEKYPPALAALRERRDAAEKRLLASENDFEATSTFSSINQYLKDADRTIAVFDQVAAGDRRRATLAMVAFNELLERQRYQDAMLGRTFASMERNFGMNIEERPVPPTIKDPDSLRKAQRNYAISTAAKDVEALAGSGSVDQARTLANKLLAFDASPETRALLQRHAARAGRPDLLTN